MTRPVTPLMLGLGCVFIQVDVVCHRDNFFVRVMAARCANVMWAFQFAAVCAFIRIRRDQRIVGLTHTATAFCDLTLRDSHVLDLGQGGRIGPVVIGFGSAYRIKRYVSTPNYS